MKPHISMQKKDSRLRVTLEYIMRARVENRVTSPFAMAHMKEALFFQKVQSKRTVSTLHVSMQAQ